MGTAGAVETAWSMGRWSGERCAVDTARSSSGGDRWRDERWGPLDGQAVGTAGMVFGAKRWGPLG